MDLPRSEGEGTLMTLRELSAEPETNRVPVGLNLRVVEGKSCAFKIVIIGCNTGTPKKKPQISFLFPFFFLHRRRRRDGKGTTYA